MVAKFLLAGLVLAAVTWTGFYELFSNFRAYDDEGLLMVSNLLFLDGFTPYDEITWLYGPVQIAGVHLLHGLLDIPVTHSAVRLVTLATWLLLAGLSGLLVLALTSSKAWALSGLVLAFMFTHSIVNEPGHPQVVVAIGTVLIPLVAAQLGGARPWVVWFGAGILTALVFHIKINAGVFVFAAVALVLCSQAIFTSWRYPLRLIAVPACFAFPFLLMIPLLAEENCLEFALISAISLAAVAITALAPSGGRPVRPLLCVAFLAGFLLVSGAALIYALVIGIALSDMASAILHYAGNQVGFYHFFREYSSLQVILAAASPFAALYVVMARDGKIARELVTVLKVWFGFAATYSLLVDGPAQSQAMLGYAGAWCWLVAWTRQRPALNQPRLLLAATAAWSPLLAYPIPGSQLYFGSLPILLAALVCVSDVVEHLRDRLQLDSPRFLRGLVARTHLLTLVAVLAVLCMQWNSSRQRYHNFEPLGLSGTQLLHIEPRRARYYRQLVERTRQADVVVTTFRFNSLYLWSDAKMPGAAYLSQWPIEHSSPDAKEQVRIGLQNARTPVVITRAGELDSRPLGEFMAWVAVRFEAYRRVGPYVLMRPKRQLPVRVPAEDVY